nr:uncharacterized protein LOC129164486 isoform X2 [Nothobranchius furzeri]XP_054600875.1 uncharacterized protein LOC129164486 isoform X2 [Nothobranchius furzeri]
MGWPCKLCTKVLPVKTDILKHYRLHHGTYGHSCALPCIHVECPCSFKNWSSLRSHLSRSHQAVHSLKSQVDVSYTCILCQKQGFPSEKDFFEHLGHHLKNNETVKCVFTGCNHQTNIYGTFATHKHRKHTPHSLKDFKPGIICQGQLPHTEEALVFETYSGVGDHGEGNCEVSRANTQSEEEDRSLLVIDYIASLLLKLESVHLVSVRCIDELVDDLYFISSSATKSSVRDIVVSHLTKTNQTIDETFVSSLVEELCKSNPLSLALNSGGPLSSSFRRRDYFKKNFEVVEPIECILEPKEKSCFQYVPILQSLTQLLAKQNIREKILSKERELPSTLYKSYRDATIYKDNSFYSEELRISLLLYIDDFEICNPLGTSRKKHKITAVYWTFNNNPLSSRSTLNSVYLVLLCKAVDIKKYGYDQVLAPLLKDIAILEQDGIYISTLGQNVKGSVLCVAADNLGAHSISGLVENFSGPFVCRFCLGQRSDFQIKEVRSGAFPLRTKEEHASHVLTIKANPAWTHFYGVKKSCPLTENLKYFHCVTGYPPDILHDIFEGIVPLELGLCFSVFLSKKYFSFIELNSAILQFPYKWADKTDCPQALPANLSSKKKLGGNAHENWTLIRLLPFIIGHRIPLNDPNWLLLMSLKDIVELVVAPVHNEESIAYLDYKISEHRYRFKEAFPDEDFIPKHHFLEHYPGLIKAFGPLIAFWTMRFEAKHSQFKRIVRHTGNFKNVLLSMATKHQLMMSHYLHSTTIEPALGVVRVKSVPLDVLHLDIQASIKHLYPSHDQVQLADTVTYQGTRYTQGMIVAYGSTAGLPDFAEIIQITIFAERVHFILRTLVSWFDEHYRGYYLERTDHTILIEQQSLSDICPLSAYVVEGKRMVTLKRHICLRC